MNEIEVITNIRKSPDKPELVVTLRKLAAQGGEICIVGEPVETRLDMATHQVQRRWESTPISPFLDQGRIKTTRRAVEVLHSLSEQERLLIMEEAYALVDIPPANWPGEKVITLEGEPTTYLLSVKPDLRVFLKPIEWEQGLEIVDVVREDALEAFIQSEVDQGEKG